MHLTFFHVDPKRREQQNRKPKTKNQRREDQPALLAKKVATAAVAPMIRIMEPNTA
jgi:hypothetical protein